MPKASPAQTSFNAGELSPRLEGRADLAKYVNGCRTLRNFLPMVQGPAIKRSGTRFVTSVKTATNVTRLVPFEFGTTQAYILELGNLYARVYMNSGAVLEPTVAVTDVANTTPIRVTSAAHGYATGDKVYISGTGLPAVNNGYFHVTVIDATHLDLIGTSAAGSGGSGGTVARAYEFVTPYVTADLAALQFAQSADVLYIAHPSHPPSKISRTAHTSWTHTEIAFLVPPFSQENLDPNEFMPDTLVVGVGPIYSTGGRFRAGHVGGHVKFSETLEGCYPEWTQSTDPSTGVNEFNDYRIEATQFGNPPNDLAHYQGRLYRYIGAYGATRSGSAPPLHEVGVQNDGYYDWEFVNHGYGWAQITAVTDAYRATGNVIRELGQTVVSASSNVTLITHASGTATVTTSTAHLMNPGAKVFMYGTLNAAINNSVYTVVTAPTSTTFTIVTGSSGSSGSGGIANRVRMTNTTMAVRRRRIDTTRFAFGSFSDERGYPSSVAFFEDRLWWAGTASDPQAVWGSRTGRYEDHLITDEDDGALFLLLNTQQVNKIEWLSAGRGLVAGTAGGEFVFSGATEGPITAGNARAPQHSFYGSRANAPPLRVESSTLFVQRSGRKLIEFGFDTATDNFIGADLTVLAHHITLGRIAKLSWAQEPDRIVWAILEDGGLVAMTYDRGQEVVGWHQHVIGGASAVESVAVIPHPAGDRDQVWLIVRRTVNGSVVRHIEFFEATWLAGTVIADAFFVDSGLTYAGAPATQILGLWHLLNEPVTVLADGISRPGLTVGSLGQITLPVAAAVVQVGLAYEASLETMRLEAGGADGTSQGKTKRITDTVLRLEDTGPGLSYGSRPHTGSQMVFGSVGLDEYRIEPGTLKSGDTEILPWPSGYEQDGRLTLVHDEPTPCTIIAIFPQVVTEDR